MKDIPIDDALRALDEAKSAQEQASSENAVQAALGRVRLVAQRFAEEGADAHVIAYERVFLTDAALLSRLSPAHYESLVYRTVKAAGVRIGPWCAAVRAEVRSQESQQNPVDFSRGDHVELAERLLRDLQGDEPVAPISDHGELFVYESASGLWNKLNDDQLMPRVAKYAGARVATSTGKTATLRLRTGDLAGAAQLARAQCRTDRFFDAAPDGIMFRNGFAALDGASVVLRPLSHEHRATFSLSFDFDPSAKAPRWQRYLEEVFHGQPDIEQRINLIEEWVGTVLFGLATAHEKSLLLVGQVGDNGKSVLLHVLTALFPPSAQRSISPQLWGNNFFVADLAGARLNVVNEIPDIEIAANDTFKAIISGNPVTAARKGRDPFTFTPRAGHLFACNALPGTRDQSGGFWKRWIVLTFERTFAPVEQNPRLRFELVEEELPGIAARVVAALARFVARGRRFDMPVTAERAKEAWRFESDQVAQFFDDRDEMEKLIESNKHRASHQRHKDGPEWTSATPLYLAYAAWAKASGHAQISKTKFGSKVKQLLGESRWVKAEDYVWYRIVPQAAGESGGFKNNPPGTSSDETQGAGGSGGSGGFARARHEKNDFGSSRGDQRDSGSISVSYLNPPEPSIPPGTRKNTGRSPGELTGGLEQPSSGRSAPPTVERFVRECCERNGTESLRVFSEALALWAEIHRLGSTPKETNLERSLALIGVRVTGDVVHLRVLDDWLSSPPTTGGAHGSA